LCRPSIDAAGFECKGRVNLSLRMLPSVVVMFSRSLCANGLNWSGTCWLIRFDARLLLLPSS
jgi:hypothetical protein